MLKATEAFNKIKKMNDEHHGQAGQMEEICKMMGFSDFKNEQRSRGNNFLLEAVEKTLI